MSALEVFGRPVAVMNDSFVSENDQIQWRCLVNHRFTLTFLINSESTRIHGYFP